MASTVPNAVYHSVEHASHELYSVVTEVNAVHLVFTFLAAFILVFGMISALIKEKLYAGEAIVATAFGIIFGPHCANLIDPRQWGNPSFDDITLEFTRIVLALSVFAVGVELPRAYVKRHWRSLIMVLGPLMIGGWLITGGLIYALVPRLSFLGALVVAACATPTDPILAASVVGKGKFAQKHVPSHIRHLLQCESGCNDGAAFPFLYLAMFLLFREDRSVGTAVGMWIVLVILYQIVLGIIIGVAVGIIARKLLKFAKRRELIDRESMVAMYVSLAIFTTAVTTLAGSDDLLAAFACGAAFAWDDWFSESIEDSNFSNILDLLINCATFIYIGATMPFQDFENSMLTLKAWRLAVLGIAVLLIRRLPIMLALYKFIPDIKTFREAIFAGFFGPMGVGAIFIATLALSKLPTPNVPPETSDDVLALTIQPITYFLVLCSIIVHGSSVPFFNLGRRVHTVTRTWTNRSESEPNWLSRVKRAGADGNVDLPRDEKNDEKTAHRRREERDLEAAQDENGDIGNQAIDDPGMDTGDFSVRDYATGKGVHKSRNRNGGNGNKISPTSSDRTVAGSSQPSKTPDGEEDNDNTFGKKDKRPERHDSGSSDEDEVWDEGDDIVTDHHHGEDVEVRHKGKKGKNASKDSSDDNGESHQRHQDEEGPGFPGHRFEEIEKMLVGGGGTASDDDGTAEDDADEEEEEEEEEERMQGPSTSRKQTGNESDSSDLLREASRRVASKQIAEEKAAKADEEPRAEPKSSKASSSAEPQPEPPKPKARMSAQRLASMTGLVRPQPNRKPTLTAEEKRARDAWCKKERKDVDDDQVKTWISGKHLVIERNNGEDVEIIDANPSKEAREKAKNSKDVNLRELPIQQVQNAKEDVAKERKGAAATASSSEGVGNVAKSHPQKRFDLKSLRQNQSFKKLFGHDESADKAGPSTSQGIPTIMEDAPEDEAEARALPQAPSSSDNATTMPSIIRQRSNIPSNDSNQGDERHSYFPARGTGIPVERTETTDSQVRFGNLPRPSRR